jgi:hypothetical protein
MCAVASSRGMPTATVQPVTGERAKVEITACPSAVTVSIRPFRLAAQNPLAQRPAPGLPR